MKTVTVEIEDDEVLVALTRPDGYEDVCPSLVAEDALQRTTFEYRTVWPEIAP